MPEDPKDDRISVATGHFTPPPNLKVPDIPRVTTFDDILKELKEINTKLSQILLKLP